MTCSAHLERPSVSAMLWPALLAMLVTAVLQVIYVAKHGGDPSTLVCAGRNRAGQPPYEAITAPVGPNGYDGQFYYAIARNPWTCHLNEGIDHPAARHLRLLYPAICWLVSGGQQDLLIYVMPAVNLLAIGGLTLLGSWIALHHGHVAGWGLTLPLALNAALPALHNLTDPLAFFALTALLVVWRIRGPETLLFLCATAALLSREQNLAIVGLLGLAALYRRRWYSVVILGSAAAFWIAWVYVLRDAYGKWPFLPGSGNFDLPFRGMFFRWSHPGGNDGFSRRLALLLMASLLHLLFQIAVGTYCAWQRPWSVTTACILAGSGLALFAGSAIYCDFWSYTRVFFWLPLGIWLYGLDTPGRWPWLALLPALIWPIVGALRYV